MKRSQDALAASPDDGGPSPASKKQKISSTVSVDVTAKDDGGGWTKVERRAQKKQKKIEAKQGVRRVLSCCW